MLTQEGEIAFETIKEMLQRAPVLALPNYYKKFFLYVLALVDLMSLMILQAQY